MKVGLNLWTLIGFGYAQRPDLAEAVRTAKELGYDGAEVVYDDSLLHPRDISKEERRKIREV
ncbi:MAG: hypothetical protein QW407_07600, partial [Thermofilaceae archaeon]